MKKIFILLIAVLLTVMTGCTNTNTGNNDSKEYISVTFNGSCKDKTVEIEKGSPLGDAEQFGLVYDELGSNETLESIDFYYADTFETVDFSAPVNEDTAIIVQITVSTMAIPVDDDNNDVYIDVLEIDVPNCRYEENGIRYKAILRPGATFQLDGVVYPDNATNKNIIYTIDTDNGVVSLDETGLITANKYGSTMVRATAEACGINLGILVMVEGYDITAEVPNQKDVYILRDTIDYEVIVNHYYNLKSKESYELPQNATLEILSGENVLTFDNTTGELRVSDNPSSQQNITFRFVISDETGTDYSNELTVNVGRIIN